MRINIFIIDVYILKFRIYYKMDINLAVQQFQVVVNDFVNHKDFTVEGNKIFKEKQKRLINFSQSFNSLGVCLITLENSTDPTAMYFASQFVKDKLKFQFQQLSKEAVLQTHSKIIHIIRTKTNLTKIITSNLALSLSFLYIHCYDQLGSALNFIKNTFGVTDKEKESASPPNSNLYFQYLFRYLDGLACEIDSKRLVIDQMKRNEVLKVLKKQQTEILLALHHFYAQLSSKQSTFKLSMSDMENILFSFSEWLRIEPPSKEIIQEIHNHSVFHFAIASLNDQELSEPATECLLAIMEVVVSPDHNPTFFEFMGSHLEYFFKCIDKKINEQEFDEAENYVKVLSEYGLSAAKVFVEKFGPIPQLFIEKMVKYTADPLMQVFNQLVDFWQTMIYFISNRSQTSTLDKTTAHKIISVLYQTFAQKIRYNTTQVHELDQLSERQLAKLHQSIDDVRERRDCSRYIFESIAKFLGNEAYIHEIVILCKAVDRNGENYWGKIEAYIYSLRDVVKNCVQPTPDLCDLVLFFQSLSEKHMIVLKSILRVYGSLQTMQEKSEEFLLRILGHMTTMFDEPQLADKTGETFVKCCEQNASILVKHISSLYQLLNKYPDRDSVLVGLTFILKMYPDLLSTNLPQIIQGPLARLKNAQSKKDKRNEFNKLFTIIQCVPKGQTKNISEIIELLLKEMWSIVSQILKEPEQAETDQDRLIERAVKFLKLVMRSIPEQFVKYLNEIFKVVIEAYKKYPINSYVYLYEVTFTVYQKTTNAEILLFLKNLYQQYCSITYLHLNTDTAIVNYQHLVDDFIGLNKRMVTFNTKMFFESQQVQPILQFSTHCLGSSIPRVASSASQLFEIIFMIYWTEYSRKKYENESKGQVVEYDPKNATLYNELKKFILPSVPKMLRQMFKFLQTGPVESARSNIIDCLEAIALAFPVESAQLWSQPLSELAEDILTSKQRQRLKQKILKLSSQNHLEFVNSQMTVNKLLVTISSRYLYRKSRAEDLMRR